MNHIPVILAFDANYINPAAALIASILKNAAESSFVEFNILYTGITKKDQEKIQDISAINPNCSFKFIDMDKYTNEIDLSGFMSVRDDYKYISTATYYRFFLADIFKNHSKVLYLDIDMIVEADLCPLYNTDLSNYYAGVVQDAFIKEHLRDRHISPYKNLSFNDYFDLKLKKKNQSYFNAGMMLINLDLIRQDNISKKLFEFAEKESPLVFQDQDIMNVVLEEKLKYLDPKYNVFPQFADHIKNPAIIHYVGPVKPHNKETGIGLWEKYWEYFKLTPFYGTKDKLFIEAINAIKPDYIKCFNLFGKRIFKIKKYSERLKVRILNKTYVFKKKNTSQSKINKQVFKYLGKKVALYGAGRFADEVFNKFDLSGFNIVAIADRKFQDEKNRYFHGLNCITPFELRDIDCDVILVSNLNFEKFLDYIEDGLIEGSKNEDIEIQPLLR